MMKLLSMSVLCVGIGTIAVAVPEIAKTNVLRAQPFFVDDFEDGDSTDGSPVTWVPTVTTPGAPVVSNGDFLISTSTLAREVRGYFVEELPALGNVTLRTQLRFLSAQQGFMLAGVFARATDPSNQSTAYVGSVFADGRLRIVEVNEQLQNANEFTVATGMNPLLNDVILDFAVRGTEVNLTAWELGTPRPSAPQLTFSDTTLTEGSVGVFVDSAIGGQASVAFRSFASIPEPESVRIAAVGMANLAGFVLLRRRRIG